MIEPLFITKELYSYIKNPENEDVVFRKPQTCPHCGINTDSLFVSSIQRTYEERAAAGQLIIFAWRCTACAKLYASFHNLKNGACSYLDMFPKINSSFEDKQIERVSPRFIEMYNQALRAEDNNDYNLAAVDMRSALEILIKDFAIVCLNEDRDTVINLKLFDAISKYFYNKDVLKVADVIRILGNDHTHYERKYPECDYELLKSYMDIFIGQIRTQILIKHPPVARKDQASNQ
jgi:hypothetical protein